MAEIHAPEGEARTRLAILMLRAKGAQLFFRFRRSADHSNRGRVGSMCRALITSATTLLLTHARERA